MRTSPGALLLILLLIPFHIVSAQSSEILTFKKARRLPVGLSGMAYCSTNNQLIAAGGTTRTLPYSSLLLIYDPNVDDWMDMTRASPVESTRHGRAVYLEDFERILLVGGTTPVGPNIRLADEFISYDLKTFKTQSLGKNPIPTKLPGVAYWEDKVYVFGGSITDKTYTNRLYVYDLNTGEIEFLPPMLETKETNGGIIEGQLYTFGGSNDRPNANIHRYDLETREWTSVGVFDNPVSAYALVNYKSYFLLIGDYENMDQLIVFDTKTETWERYTMNFQGRHLGAGVIEDVLHVFGGSLPGEVLGHHRTLDLNELLDEG